MYMSRLRGTRPVSVAFSRMLHGSDDTNNCNAIHNSTNSDNSNDEHNSNTMNNYCKNKRIRRTHETRCHAALSPNRRPDHPCSCSYDNPIAYTNDLLILHRSFKRQPCFTRPTLWINYCRFS